MTVTVLHVISDLGTGKAAHMLERVVLSDQSPGGSRQVVVSLADSGMHAGAFRDAGVELHDLGLANLLRIPGALVRLTRLMRRIRPDVVMTWLYAAHSLATLAAVASGVGARRVVWNVSGSSTKASSLTRKTRFKLMLLAALSPLPWAIAADTRIGWRAHQALGYSPRRWFRLHGSADEAGIERALASYRQLWRFASGIEPFPERPGFLQSRIYPQLRAYWARIRRPWLMKTTFIGVTGSCGKTTTTILVEAVLETAGQCRTCAGANDYGSMIENILSAGPSTKFCIQEVSGMYLGRVARYCRVLRPQVGIVTTVGGDHYRNFRSLEATAQSKGQLVEALPQTGIAILNADDPHVIAMVDRTSARVITYGRSADADVRATGISSAWPERLAMTVTHGHDTIRIQTNLVGEHWTGTVLAAIACGLVCGIDLKTCAKAIESFEPWFGRCSVHAKPDGPVFILDNKAPYWTIAASLAFTKSAEARRTTIVFGTISDYPGKAGRRYRGVAREALDVADRVVFVGPHSDRVSKLRQGELRDRLHAFGTAYQASEFLAQTAVPGELIFIKASPAADHLERIILSQIDRVVCWRERCGRRVSCQRCRDYRTPHPPPFGLAGIESPVAASPDIAASARAQRGALSPRSSSRGR